MRIRRLSPSPIFIPALLLTSLIHSGALAQANRQPQLEEVIVTATKRASNLQDVYPLLSPHCRAGIWSTR
jgi:outer membrane cobalamin receptor